MRVPRHFLSGRQRIVLDVIARYVRNTGEPCSGSYIARHLGIHHSTVQEHISALYRKGWLMTPNAPAMPQRERETPRKVCGPADSTG